MSVEFKRAIPDVKMYPHYNSMINGPISNLGLLGAFAGVSIEVNSSGTEYEFYSFKNEVGSITLGGEEDWEIERNKRYSMVLAYDFVNYPLHAKADAMKELFRVSEEAFNLGDDRRSMISSRCLRRAYMMSALRSFAWTLYSYCKDNGNSPADVSSSELDELIEFIASCNWLNYNDKAMNGLCCGTDIHNYFLPDKVPENIKRQFLPDKKTIAEEKKRMADNPNYNPMLQEICSLDKLREDLAYIYPAILTIYEELKENRNYDEPLEGNAADVLFAWCSLAYSADGPFFVEDGPISFWGDDSSDIDLSSDYEKVLYDGNVETNELTVTDLFPISASLEGTAYEGRNARIENVRVGDKLIFKADYNNSYYSPVAIEVFNSNNGSLGYIQQHYDYDSCIDLSNLELIARYKDELIATVESVTPLSARRKNAKYALMDIKFSPSGKKATTKTAQKGANSAPKTTSTTKKASTTKTDSTQGQEQIAVVNDTWEVTIPNGYIYCTDKSIIREHRDIIIMEDKKKNSFENPFGATESFTSMFKELDDAALNAPRLANYLLNDEHQIVTIRKDAELYIAYSFLRRDELYENGKNNTLDIFQLIVGAGNYLSTFQVFFNNSKKTHESQQLLVDKVARSIRLKGESKAQGIDPAVYAEAQKEADEISNSLNEAMSKIGDQLKEMGKSLEAAKEVMDKVEESRESKEQNDEERRQKVFNALGDESRELVMFSALYTDKQMNNPNSKQNDFYDCYQDEFGKITKKDLFALRKDIMQKMKNSSYTDKQKEKIKGFDFEIRYHLMALMLFNASLVDDPEESKAFTLIKSAEWFSDKEITLLEELLNSEINEVRESVGGQLSSFDPDWANFDTAKKHLIAKIAYPSDYKGDDNPEFFAIEKDCKYSLRVKLTSNGIFGAGIINLMPWYWNTTIEEVWEAALKKVEYAEDCIFPKKEQKDFVAEAIGLVNRKISENPIKKVMIAALKQKELENSDLASKDSDWEIKEYKNGTVGIKKYLGNKEKVLIPTEIGGKTVSKVLYTTFIDDSSSIKELAIPSSLAEGDCYFLDNMRGVERVVFLEGVKNVPSITFCNDLKSIELPDSVTDISFTISYCPNLNKINIPKNVSCILHSFEHCNSLEEIIVSPENTKFSSDNGSLYNNDKTELLRAASSKSFEFNKTIKEIGKKAFDGCDKLLEITVPSSVKKIGECAFNECSSLKKAVILGCDSNLSPKVFLGCKNLEEVSLPDCVTSIDSKAFEDCSSLKKVALSPRIKTIAKDAFNGCISMEEITLPRRFETKAKDLFKQSPNIKITYIDPETNKPTTKKAPSTTAKPKTIKETSEVKTKPATQGQPKATPAEQNRPAEEPREKKKGCYVATCAYGSYDCPEVWTLRRFRDYVLAKTWYGRLFILAYYFVAPKLVRVFGNSEWFKNIWRNYLDNKVEKLNNLGFENTPYDDLEW